MRNKIFAFLIVLFSFLVFVPSVEASCTFNWEEGSIETNGVHWYKFFLINELNPTNPYVYKITWDSSNSVTFDSAQDNSTSFSSYGFPPCSESHCMLIDSMGGLPNNYLQYYTNVSLIVTGNSHLLNFSAYEGNDNCTNLHTPTPTPTPIPTPSPSPAPTDTPNSCGGTCGSNSNCNSNLVCYSGYCRNQNCTSSTDCNCPSITPTPTPTKTPSPTKTPTPTPTQKPNPTESPEVLGAETVQTEPSIIPESVPSVSDNKNIIIAGILIGSGITLIGTSIYLNLRAEKSSKLQNDI